MELSRVTELEKRERELLDRLDHLQESRCAEQEALLREQATICEQLSEANTELKYWHSGRLKPE